MYPPKQQRSSVVLSVFVAVFLAPVLALAVQTELNVAVPMRDGVILRADVFRPDEPGPYPVLVMRTPYDKDGAESRTPM